MFDFPVSAALRDVMDVHPFTSQDNFIYANLRHIVIVVAREKLVDPPSVFPGRGKFAGEPLLAPVGWAHLCIGGKNRPAIQWSFDPAGGDLLVRHRPVSRYPHHSHGHDRHKMTELYPMFREFEKSLTQFS